MRYDPGQIHEVIPCRKRMSLIRSIKRLDIITPDQGDYNTDQISEAIKFIN